MESPIIFINIGWMKKYAGPSATDKLEADNFGYFKNNKNKNPIGHEQWNFLETDGYVYGYVPRSAGINISRLGADAHAEKVGGVLVVFISRDPAAQQLKVVGWYKNATVARTAAYSRTFGDTEIWAPIFANATDSYVLPVAQRFITVPTAKREPGGVGQSPVWYAENHPDLVRRIRELVEIPNSKPPQKDNSQRPPRNNDPAARLAVEKAAMDWALNYFDDAIDISRECKGWDVEAVSNLDQIYIEVKGISGSLVFFELTPNEYEKMQKYKDRYLIFVVTEALTPRAQARTFRWTSLSDGAGTWTSENGEVLKIQERTGAWGSVK